MNIFTLLYLLPCLLLVLQKDSTDALDSTELDDGENEEGESLLIEDQSFDDEGNPYKPFNILDMLNNLKSNVNSLQLQIRSVINEVSNTIGPIDTENRESIEKGDSDSEEELVSSGNKMDKWLLARHVLIKANDFRKQYSYLIPAITFMLPGGMVMNTFRFMGVLPYLVLIMEKINAPVVQDIDENKMDEFGELNLAALMENPDKLKEMFLNKDRGEFIIESMKVIAGSSVSLTVDNLIETVKKHANDSENGENGIVGDRLVSIIENKTSFDKLFRNKKECNQALNLLNAFVGYTLNPEKENAKIQIINVMKNSKSIAEKSFKDSVSSYFKVGQTLLENKIHDINVNAASNVNKWKQASGDSKATGLSKISSMAVNNASDDTLNLIAKGYVLSNDYGSYAPNAAKYFLPVGVGMNIFKFMCLTTYVMHVAKKDKLISDTDQKRLLDMGIHKVGLQKLGINTQNINTGKIVEKINNADKTISKFANYSNARVNMFKFIAGSEASVVDKIADYLNKIKQEKKDNQPLTLSDLIKHTDIFKKIYEMGEFADLKIRRYFGLDSSKLVNNIIEEFNEKTRLEGDYNIENESFWFMFTNYPGYWPVILRLKSAAYAVSLKTINEKTDSIKAQIQKAYTGESVATKLLSTASKTFSMGYGKEPVTADK